MMSIRKFPGGPVVRTLCFHCQGVGFDPWLVWRKKKKKMMSINLNNNCGVTLLEQSKVEKSVCGLGMLF